MDQLPVSSNDQLARLESFLVVATEELKRSRLLPSPAACLKVSEVARVLRVGERTIRRYIEEGELRASALELGSGQKVYRIKQPDLEAFLDKRATNATGASPTPGQRRLLRVTRGLV